MSIILVKNKSHRMPFFARAPLQTILHHMPDKQNIHSISRQTSTLYRHQSRLGVTHPPGEAASVTHPPTLIGAVPRGEPPIWPSLPVATLQRAGPPLGSWRGRWPQRCRSRPLRACLNAAAGGVGGFAGVWGPHSGPAPWRQGKGGRLERGVAGRGVAGRAGVHTCGIGALKFTPCPAL